MTYRNGLAHLGALVLTASAFASPAQADFFDGARRTFQNDIPRFFQRDIPHFFQDDIPCAFGGKPTSGAKASCRSAEPAPVREPGKAQEPPPPPPAPPAR